MWKYSLLGSIDLHVVPVKLPWITWIKPITNSRDKAKVTLNEMKPVINGMGKACANATILNNMDKSNNSMGRVYEIRV